MQSYVGGPLGIVRCNQVELLDKMPFPIVVLVVSYISERLNPTHRSATDTESAYWPAIKVRRGRSDLGIAEYQSAH